MNYIQLISKSPTFVGFFVCKDDDGQIWIWLGISHHYYYLLGWFFGVVKIMVNVQMNRKYPMILVMKSMLQFVAVMDKLIQMIAMLKMQVSQNGLKARVNKKPELHQAPPSSGVFCLQTFRTTGFLTKVLPYSGQRMGWGQLIETVTHILLFFDIQALEV